MMKADYRVGRGKIEVVQGSITKYAADALVCPANQDLEMLALPGGVQYAFLVDGGEEIFLEASDLGKRLRKLSMDTHLSMAAPSTSAHITKAGRLPAKHVIHSVSLGYDTQRDRLFCNGEVIAQSTQNALKLAKEKGLTSVGFPALGTGLYDVPLEEAVEAMSKEFAQHLNGETTLERVGLVLYSPNQYSIGKRVLDRMFLSR